MAGLLFAVAGGIFVLLAAIHAVLTWRDETRPRTLAPRDPAVTRAMQGAALGIAPGTDTWKAWIGFNQSHALGAAVFGLGCLVIALAYPAALAETVVRLGAPVISALYLLLSVRYWFRTPTVGIALATAPLALGGVLA